MTQLAALIFDVDGTLAETEELHRIAFNAAFAAAHLPWHWDQPTYTALLQVTGGKERIAHFIATTTPAQAPNQAGIAALHADKTQRYTALVAEGRLAPRPGIVRILAQARQAGLKLAIATTTSHPNVAALRAACPQLGGFDVIAAGDDVPRKKPAPDIYVSALQNLGLPPECCLALEDTPNGLRSAAGAGLACLVTVSQFGGSGPFAGAAAVLSDLGEPGAPARCLAGPAPAGGLVQLDYLGELLKAGKQGLLS